MNVSRFNYLGVDGSMKVWRFDNSNQAKDFYFKTVKELKNSKIIQRLRQGRQAENGSEFIVDLDGFKFRFTLYREQTQIRLIIKNPFAKTYRDSTVISFEQLFERMPNEVRQKLAFHLDIFA